MAKLFGSGWRRALERAESALAASSTRLVLSGFIIVSVLPMSVQQELFPAALAAALDPFFLAVFSLELALRTALYARSWRARRARPDEPVLLALDLLAIVSFLPGELFGSPHALRFLRLSRLLLLLGYWGRTGRDLLEIIGRRERRQQLVIVLLFAFVLSFSGAVLLVELAADFDFDGDGTKTTADRSFYNLLWWSFRQVQDAGNLVVSPEAAAVVVLSLLLTFSGLLLFSFIVGIGTTVVEELVERARIQPVGLRGHTVVLGFGSASVFLLEGLAEIYRKNLKPFRAAVLGAARQTPEELYRPLLKACRYRRGDPVAAGDLDRVDVRHARRVLILGRDPRDPDAEVIAAILATRERNPEVDLFPDLEHERSFPAARAAGGARTHLVGSGPFLGYYLVQNLVYPGIHRLYRELLAPEGCEIYSYVFSEPERARLCALGGSFDLAALHERAWCREGVSLLGFFVAEDAERPCEVDALGVVLNPLHAAQTLSPAWVFDAVARVRRRAVRGLIGITLRWQNLRQLAASLLAGPEAAPSAALAPPVAPPVVPSWVPRLELPCPPIERLFVTGAGARLPRVISELLGFYPRLEVTVVARERARLEGVLETLRAMLEEVWGEPRVRRAQGHAELRLRAAGRHLHAVFLVGDWSDRRRQEALGTVTVATADAVLLLPEDERGEARDGAVAIDALEIANLAVAGVGGLRVAPRMVGLMADPVKADLLASRLEQLSGRVGMAVTILSGERARQQLLMQNVFVWGLNAIYLELLSFAGQHLARLVPVGAGGEPPAGGFDPWQLARWLAAERGLTLVGLELRTEAGERAELDPHRLAAGSSVAWSQVAAVYVLGQWRAARA